MIDQVNVFLENSKGRLAAMCRCLSEANINMDALTIAETSDYGLVRIICSDPNKALNALRKNEFRASTTKVCAIAVPNCVGGLAKLLDILDKQNINIEYGYCFMLGDNAIDVFKIGADSQVTTILSTLKEMGYTILSQGDIA